MTESSDDNENDPFEEDIVFDQSDLLVKRSSCYLQNNSNIPTFTIFIRTVFLCIAFFGLGLCSSISTGPVIHLLLAMGISHEDAFHSFTAHCFGMVIGGILGSLLFDKYNRQFLILIGLIWMSVSICVLPFMVPISFLWTLVNLAVLGIGLSFIFTGSNVLCLDLWGKQSGVYMQSLHFSFALGAVITPAVIQPLLHATFYNSEISNYTNSSNYAFSSKHGRNVEILPNETTNAWLNQTLNDTNGFKNSSQMDDNLVPKIRNVQSTSLNSSLVENGNKNYPLNRSDFELLQVNKMKDTDFSEITTTKSSLIVKQPNEESINLINSTKTNKIITIKDNSTSTNDTDYSFINDVMKEFKNYGITDIHIVYICVGIFLFFAAFLAILLLCHNPREPRSKQEESAISDVDKKRGILFMCIFSVFMLTAESLQGAMHHLIASFNTKDSINPLVEENFNGTSLFWGLILGSRFVCIWLSGCFKVKPAKLLLVATFFTVVGTVFFCIGTYNKDDFLWTGVIVIALGIAAVLPTSFLWMGDHMRVTHKMCALMIIFSSFGNTITHSSLTQVVTKSHAYGFTLLIISISSLVLLCSSLFLLYRFQKTQSLGIPVGYHLASQEEGEAHELRRATSQKGEEIPRKSCEIEEARESLLID